MTARYLEPGTVRVHTCRRCGDVYREVWVAREPSGFRVSGEKADGSRIQDETVRDCPDRQPGIQAGHDFETMTITVAAEAS